MASARKIAANQRNGAKSTGPRSATAKRRTRRNALRHGLTARTVFDVNHLRRIDTTARELAGASGDFTSMEFARAVARAELDLERIRQLKAGLINAAASSMIIAKAPGEMPPDLETAAISQVLRELVKIDRYESQAVARRDRAIHALMNPRLDQDASVGTRRSQ